MHQIIQNIRNGKLSVKEIPDPVVKPGHVLIANAYSVISAGTERAAIELAKKSLLGKAKQRPDQVRRVLEKLKNEGILNTISQVRERLDEPLAMGYSSAGVVLACGDGVQEFKPGDRVASNGPHAGVVWSQTFVREIPEGFLEPRPSVWEPLPFGEFGWPSWTGRPLSSLAWVDRTTDGGHLKAQGCNVWH
jgi:hypothetical protein